MSQSAQSELTGILFQEIEGYIPEIESGVSFIQESSKDIENLKEVYRFFHNIKGAASQVPFTGLSDSAAVCEAVVANLLDSGENDPCSEQCNFLRQINSNIDQFCKQADKSAQADASVFTKTMDEFAKLGARLPHGKLITLPDYLEKKYLDEENAVDVTDSTFRQPAQLRLIQDECLQALRSIFPLLKELADCADEQNPIVLPDKILSAMGNAVSTLSQCSQAAGLHGQYRLLSGFLIIINQLRESPELIVEDTAILLQEFLSYVDLVFSLGASEGEAAINRIQVHLNTLTGLLLQNFSDHDRPNPHLEQATDEAGLFDLQPDKGGDEEEEFYDVYIESTDHAEGQNNDDESPTLLNDNESEEEPFLDFDSVFDDLDANDPLADTSSLSSSGEFDGDDQIAGVNQLEDEFLEEHHEQPGPLASSELSEEEAELLAIFQAECEEHLQNIDQDLTVLSRDVTSATELSPEIDEAMGRVRRGVHTLKGAAAMCGFTDLAGCARNVEELLDWLHDTGNEIVPADIDVIREASDVIQTLSYLPANAEKELAESVADAVNAHLELRALALESSPEGVTEITTEPDLSTAELEEEVVEDLESDTMDLLENQDLETLEADVSNDPAPEVAVDSSEESTDLNDVFLDEEQKELLAIFQAECEEHLQTITSELNNLSATILEPTQLDAQIKETIGEIRRGVHTLKGAAAMTGFDAISTCAHTAEDLLDWIHDEAKEIVPEDISIVTDVADTIEILSQSPTADQYENAELVSAAVKLHLQERVAPPSQAAEPDSTPEVLESETSSLAEADLPTEVKAEDSQPETNLSFQRAPEVTDEEGSTLPADTGNVRVKLNDLDELVNIEGEMVVARGSIEKLLDQFSRSLNELNTIKDTLRRKSQELEVGFEAQSLYGFGSGPLPGLGDTTGSESTLSEFDPIELDRYSQLNLIIRSLNEISIDVNAIHSEMTALGTSLEGQVAKQQLSMGLMQEKLMRIRMTPLSSISRVLFRTVRQTAKRLGKNVQLTIAGEDVFMDRFIWTRTIDPLMHILRNCVDHGIEDKAERNESGKPAKGSIHLDAQQKGRFVVIKISDDGKGVDLEKLRTVLIEENFISEDEQLNDETLLNYLFRPSVSTKDDVSQVSGRGVGLDVVLRNIQELRGTVQIHNSPGQGITFELSIPITLAVNRAVIIDLVGNNYAVPLQDVSEVRKFTQADLQGEEQNLVEWNDTLIPLVDLAPQLQLPVSKSQDPERDILTLIVDTGEKHVAMKIDRVDEQREIVIKDLGSHLKYVRGINGVTLTGEGAIIPILNLRELSTGHKPAAATTETVEAIIPQQQEPLKVLVVDDSISVRFSISRLVESQTWQAHQAVDGLDALEKLETFTPDVIILDIEMPRMNGYEFLAMLRNREEYKSIPVIMLTSRASEKHRKKAEELGADHYMTKPFQNDNFIELLSAMQ